MRFLADESCDYGVAVALRTAGHDVVAIAEVSPREDDDIVIARARRDGRILITEDKDFGRLVFAGARASEGVLFLRFPAKARAGIADTVVELVARERDRPQGKFTVVQPGRVRLRRRALK